MNDLFLDTLPASHWAQEWDAYLQSGDDSTVLPILERMVRGILQAPEYQLG